MSGGVYCGAMSEGRRQHADTSDDAGANPVRARNLELKVRCGMSELDDVRVRLLALGLPIARHERQVDTYFAVRHGRLKLRTIAPADGRPAVELIAYARPDATGSRWSEYRRVPLATADAPEMERALAETIGVAVVVAKTREVVIRGRTRIHLDRVDGLGAFIELETVLTDQSAAAAQTEHAATAELLGLDRFAPVAGSYRDLAMERDADREEPRLTSERAGEETG